MTTGIMHITKRVRESKSWLFPYILYILVVCSCSLRIKTISSKQKWTFLLAGLILLCAALYSLAIQTLKYHDVLDKLTSIGWVGRWAGHVSGQVNSRVLFSTPYITYLYSSKSKDGKQKMYLKKSLLKFYYTWKFKKCCAEVRLLREADVCERSAVLLIYLPLLFSLASN